MKSVINGLEEVLNDYRHQIADLEQEFIQDVSTPLSSILRTLSSYQLILPHLSKLVIEIDEGHLYGGPLLDILYKHSCTGIPVYKGCIERIRRRCHVVLLNQLGAWILHGILIDNCYEFFIF